MADDFRNY